MTMSLLLRHWYLLSHSVQYFAQQFSSATRQVLNCIASYEKSEQVQQVNLFKRQTLRFHFQGIVQIHLNIYPITHQFDRMRESTAAIIASVVETTQRPGVLPHQQHFLDHEQTSYIKRVLLVS